MTSGVTAVPGFVAGGLACGIKPSGDPDLALVATDDARPVSAAGVFTTNLAQAAPVQISRRHLANGTAAAVVLSSGNANAATGEPGRRDARSHVRARGAGASASQPTTCWCARPASSVSRCRWTRSRSASRSCAASSRADGGGRAARAMMTTDTKVKEAVARAGAATVGRDGQGRSDAVARDGDHARGRHDRCRRRSRHAATRARAGGAGDASTVSPSTAAARRTTPCWCWRTDGRARSMPHALTGALTEVCGSLAEQMARDAEGATKFVRVRVVGARNDRRSPDRGPGRGEQPARAVLAQRQRSLLGAGAVGARRERRVSRSRSGRHRLQRRHRVPRRRRVRARRSRDHARPRASTTSRSSATCARRTARRRCSPPISRTRTSTRTGARREHESRERGDHDLASRVKDAGEKAHILADALPYIREFSGKTVVIKYGGHAMENPELAELFATDVVLMRLVGMNPVVVHGGGPQITDLMRRLGKEPEFVDGRRVTDAETVDIVRMALVGKVNREIVAMVNRLGSYAVGMSGEDAGLIRVDQRDPRLGFVGDVRSIDPTMVLRLLREELIPVIATIGVDDDGPGVQHQRRHGGRRDRGVARGGEARLPHRRRRRVRRLARRVDADLARRRRRPREADRRRQGVGGDDPQARVVRRPRCATACGARTSSTAACPTRCCSNSSPGRASEPWCTTDRATAVLTRDLQRALDADERHADLRAAAGRVRARRGNEALGQ